MAKLRKQMPSQFPALRLSVAQQMAGYEERIAQKIRREAGRRGKSPVDLASDLGTHTTTTERWFRGERVPQRRHRKDLIERWNLPPDFFEPDLEAEEKEVRDQLNRIEQKLDLLLDASGVKWAPKRAVAAAIQARQKSQPQSAGKHPAKAKKRRAG